MAESGINNPFEIGGLLLVINFKAPKLKLHYHIGIQLPKILVGYKKEYRQTRSVTLEKMITQKKAIYKLEKLEKEAYEENVSNNKETYEENGSNNNVNVNVKLQGSSSKQTLKSLKDDINEVEMIIDKINRVTL